MFNELRSLIREAFPSEPAVKYRLSRAIIDDDYGEETNAFEESWGTWEEIEDWQVTRCYVFFSFAPAEAKEYFLPRYMIFLLDQIEGKIDDGIYSNASDLSGESAVYYIKRLKKGNYAKCNFNEFQVGVIETFLESTREF